MNLHTPSQPTPEPADHTPPFEFSEAAVADVARRCMGTNPALFYAPHIPAEKDEGARHGCANIVPANIPLPVLYDDTTTGDASNGFVLTTWGLLWKSVFEFADRLAWSEIDPATVETSIDGVRVNGRDVKISKSELRPGFIRAVRELAGYAQ